MIATPHLGGGPQQPPAALQDVAAPRLAQFSGLLGNLRAQSPVSAESEFRDEELWLWASLNRQFGSARPESKLATLKRQRFSPEGRDERIRVALASLEAPQPTRLTLEEWKAVITEVESEDEE